jgi:zeaxanthin glucosyltransferase
MATIGFFAYFDRGDLNAGLKLASALREDGHTVFYVGFADSAAYLRTQGFAYTVVFAQHFPLGSYSEMLHDNALPAGLAKLRHMRRWALRFGAFCRALPEAGADELLAVLRDHTPDLMVFSGGEAFSEWPALIASSLGVRGVYLFSALTPIPHSRVPPVESALIPNGTVWGRASVACTWLAHACARQLRDKTLAALGLDVDLEHVTRALARRFGVAAEGSRRPPGAALTLPLPEMIPWPAELEFPGYQVENRYYIESSIELGRKQPDFAWAVLDARPVVLCALGTIPWVSANEYRVFFQTVIEAARSRPQWQWIIATGGTVSLDTLHDVPAHVHCVEHAPQLGLLERALFMIGHAGTNTIKECVYFGVPMLLYPLGADQPGNAARVVHHGLGLRGHFARVTTARLLRQIDELLHSSYIRSQLALARSRARALEEARPGLRLIQSMIGEVEQRPKTSEVLADS